jgi:hypothetical protein
MMQENSGYSQATLKRLRMSATSTLFRHKVTGKTREVALIDEDNRYYFYREIRGPAPAIGWLTKATWERWSSWLDRQEVVLRLPGADYERLLEHRSSNAIWESRMPFTNAH